MHRSETAKPALKRCHYSITTNDDLLPRLKNGKVFSVCDVRNGFWHVVLDKKQAMSQLSPLRMPFEISPTPEVFQRRLNQALEELNDIYVIADDILVTGGGSTLEEVD